MGVDGQARRTNNRCPNMKCSYEGYDGERYRCDVCGESYYLDYEEMRRMSPTPIPASDVDPTAGADPDFAWDGNG